MASTRCCCCRPCCLSPRPRPQPPVLPRRHTALSSCRHSRSTRLGLGLGLTRAAGQVECASARGAWRLRRRRRRRWWVRRAGACDRRQEYGRPGVAHTSTANHRRPRRRHRSGTATCERSTCPDVFSPGVARCRRHRSTRLDSTRQILTLRPSSVRTCGRRADIPACVYANTRTSLIDDTISTVRISTVLNPPANPFFLDSPVFLGQPLPLFEIFRFPYYLLHLPFVFLSKLSYTIHSKTK